MTSFGGVLQYFISELKSSFFLVIYASFFKLFVFVFAFFFYLAVHLFCFFFYICHTVFIYLFILVVHFFN